MYTASHIEVLPPCRRSLEEGLEFKSIPPLSIPTSVLVSMSGGLCPFQYLKCTWVHRLRRCSFYCLRPWLQDPLICLYWLPMTLATMTVPVPSSAETSVALAIFCEVNCFWLISDWSPSSLPSFYNHICFIGSISILSSASSSSAHTIIII